MSESTDYDWPNLVSTASAAVDALAERNRSQARTIDFLSAQIAGLQAAHRGELAAKDARLSEQCAQLDGLDQLLFDARKEIDELMARLEEVNHVGP